MSVVACAEQPDALTIDEAAGRHGSKESTGEYLHDSTVCAD